MKMTQLPLAGAFEIQLFRFEDERGLFFKPFQASAMQEAGIYFELKESICSVTHKHIVRGMHFQTGDHAQCKLVYCPGGAILDVILDIRPGSATYGQYYATELSAANGRCLYIPEGFAHGFMALEDHSVTSYLMNREYVPDADKGLLWNSFGFAWPQEPRAVSPRDAAFPPFVK